MNDISISFSLVRLYFRVLFFSALNKFRSGRVKIIHNIHRKSPSEDKVGAALFWKFESCNTQSEV